MNGAMDRPTCLLLQNVSAELDGKRLLEHLSFSCERGEIHAVVGMAAQDLQNLADFLAGSFRSYTGACSLMGREVRLNRRKREIDIVQSGLNRFPQLSAAENIFLTQAAPLRLHKKKELHACEQMLQQFSIRMDLRRRVADLPRSAQKLLEFLRAYLRGSPVVVLSEPFLDIVKEDRASAQAILQNMKARGQSILFLTSRLEDALLIADRISVLDGGSLSMTAPTQDIIKNPKEVMYLLSGWAPLRRDDSKELDILQTIVNARAVLSSTSELRKELLYLASDISKVLSAQSCVIYLVNEEANSVVETVDENARAPLLKKDAICRLARGPGLVRLTRGTPEYFEMLREDGQVEDLLCMPAGREEQICGLIQVAFSQEHAPNRTDELYLTTFAREIGIAIETSDLIGRSMLLQESHHRIKNNLQMITSMIYMQKLYYRENGGDVEEMFDATISRISSIATVHDLLAKDKTVGSSIVNLVNIIREVVKVYERRDIAILLDVEDISIPYNKATSISLVVNELISNCVKHAFSGEPRVGGKRIEISCHNDGKNVRLTIADNGCGIPPEKLENRAGSIGMSLMRSVIASLHGTIDFFNRDGAQVRIVLPTVHVYDARNSRSGEGA